MFTTRLNEQCTKLTLSDCDDLGDYDTQRLDFDLNEVKELISDLQEYMGMMRIDPVKNEIHRLLRQREEIETRLKELGA